MSPRHLSDHELGALLRSHIPSLREAPRAPRQRGTRPLQFALFLVGALSGSLLHARWGSGEVRDVSAERDPVEMVQGAGSRYAEALALLASTAPASPEAATVAREVVASSFVGVTRSLMRASGNAPTAIDAFRLASELHHGTTGGLPVTERGEAF